MSGIHYETEKNMNSQKSDRNSGFFMNYFQVIFV